MSEKQEVLRLIHEIIATKNLGDPDAWTRSKYQGLSESILESTGELISYRTLSRIIDGIYLDKKPYKPSASTLDILARYAGYKSWFDFSHDQHPEPRSIPTSKARRIPMFSYFIGALVAAGICLAGYAIYNHEQSPRIHISSKPFIDEIPGVISFRYSLSPSGDDTTILYIAGDNSVYQYRSPKMVYLREHTSLANRDIKDLGLYEWSVRYQDELLTEGRFFGFNRKWEYFIYSTKNNGFGYRDIRQDNGIAYSTLDQAETQQLISPSGWFTKFIYADSIPLELDACTIETRVRNIYTPKPTCNIFRLSIYGVKQDIRLYLADKSCLNHTKVRVSEQTFVGKREDVSDFSRSYDDWFTLKVSLEDNIASIFLDDRLIRKIRYQEPLGQLRGFNYWFTGAGEIDYVKGYDAEGGLTYTEEFD